tara:strand:- start:79 stop:951 length:873 start_codon:yes stop_codon:yes gene_type:complete
MKTFKKQYYDDAATTTPAIRRNKARGFNDIFGELIERCLGAKSNTKLVELGVGGGGSHEFWHDCTTDSNIYGVDWWKNIEDWSEDERHKYKNHTKHLDDVYNIAVPKWKSNPRMHYIPGNTCKEQCALDLIDYTNGEKFNVIINDSIQTGFRYRHLEWLDWYSNILTDDGIILWGAVEGYYKKIYQPGDRMFKRMKEKDPNIKLPNDGVITVGETHPFVDGWVVLDLDEYADHKLLEDLAKTATAPKFGNKNTSKPHSYLWVWAHNFSLYKDILNKYKIVSGKELLDENN